MMCFCKKSEFSSGFSSNFLFLICSILSPECPVCCYDSKELEFFKDMEGCIGILSTNFLLHDTTNFYMDSLLPANLLIQIIFKSPDNMHFVILNVMNIELKKKEQESVSSTTMT